MALEGSDLEKEIRIAALENAVKFKGKANQGAIIGKLFSLDASLKAQMKTLAPMIGKILSEINSLDFDKQEHELRDLVPDFAGQEKAKKDARKKERGELPPLKEAEEGKVITRMPPGPSKYPHVGHAISFGINYLYSQMYHGKTVLRFDDTNPEVEKQEFVEAIREDVEDYLGFKADEIIYASDFMDKFYGMFDKLIETGHCYTCDCPSESISKNRKEMKSCKHHDMKKDETKSIFEEMKKGHKTDFTLRLRIEMDHKNAVMRDPVIARVITTSHYRQKRKYNVWPMYDFESPVVDGMNGITHVMRSNEFDSRIELHHYIADLFGYKAIPYKHYGRSSITGSLTQGREIRAKIDAGDFVGWDDPRLVTLKALKRRGIVREAIINLVKRAGLSKTNTNIDFSVISTENRKILDESAKRYFFIADNEAVNVTIKDAPELQNELDLHPTNNHGGRHMNTNSEFIMNKKDYDNFKDGQFIRFMDCLNFQVSNIKDKKFLYDSTEHVKFKKVGDTIIHWLPKSDNLIKTEIFMPDATTLKGHSEPAIKSLEEGDVIQFERFGFCRLDKIEKKAGVYKFWYTHD